jgi:hypothetical protein
MRCIRLIRTSSFKFLFVVPMNDLIKFCFDPPDLDAPHAPGGISIIDLFKKKKKRLDLESEKGKLMGEYY